MTETYDFRKDAEKFFAEVVDPESTTQYYGIGLLSELRLLEGKLDSVRGILREYQDMCRRILKDQKKEADRWQETLTKCNTMVNSILGEKELGAPLG